MTLTVDKGSVTEASVEDVKLLPAVRRTMFRLQGGEWVAREIVRDVNTGRDEFVVSSGDVVCRPTGFSGSSRVPTSPGKRAPP